MESVKAVLHKWKYPLVVLIVVALMIHGLSASFYPLLLAFFFAYLTYPLVLYLEARHIPRWIASIGMLIALSLIAFVALFFLLPFLFAELSSFISALPKMFEGMIHFLNNLLARSAIGYRIDPSMLGAEHLLSKMIEKLGKTDEHIVANFLNVTFSNALRIVLAFLTLCLLPVFFFYSVDRYEAIVAELKRFLPPRFEQEVYGFFSLVHRSFGQFFRGQVIVALVLAGLYALGLSLVGLKFGLMIGVLTGCLGVIPYFGHIFGLILSLLTLSLHFTGYGTLIGVLSVFAILVATEGYILTPKIVGRRVGLNAFTTLLAMIIFGEFFGFAGIVIAIPTTCLLRFYYERFIKLYHKSEFFKGGNKEPPK